MKISGILCIMIPLLSRGPDLQILICINVNYILPYCLSIAMEIVAMVTWFWSDRDCCHGNLWYHYAFLWFIGVQIADCRQ